MRVKQELDWVPRRGDKRLTVSVEMMGESPFRFTTTGLGEYMELINSFP